jgi:hypothetical protein
MRDIASRYAELAAEVDGAGLMGPHDLRRYADRRARARASVLAAAGVVVVAGTAAGGVALLDRRASLPGPADPPPATTAPATPSADPSPTPTVSSAPEPASEPSSAAGAPPPSEIPDAAFFRLPERYQKDPTQRQETDTSEALPGFCDDAFAEDDDVTVRRSVYSIYQAPGTPADYVPHGTVHQTITGYRAGGAAAFMDRLRATAADCATYRQDGTEVTFEILDPPDDGDEAVLLERTWPATEPEYSPGVAHVAVVRVGDVVTVLYVRGWETADSELEYVNRFVEWSVSAIEDWR